MSTAELAAPAPTEPPEPPADDPAPSGWHRHPRLYRGLELLAPALVFVVIREFSLLVLGWLAGRNRMSVDDLLIAWDGKWFVALTGRGYGDVPTDLVDAFGRHTPQTSLAFFPGYPVLARWFAAVFGSPTSGALAVTAVSGVVCAYGLARLGRVVPGGSPAAGLVLVVLFAAAPMSVVLEMVYSEALFCALAVWALLGVVERRWVQAGVLCALAGLVRPTAAALVLAVAAAAVLAIVQRRGGWRPWLALVLAPAGLGGYLAVVATRTGHLDGWFRLQREGWGLGLDGGRATVKSVVDTVASGQSVFEVGTVVLIGAALVSLGAMVACRLPWPLICYAVGVLVLDLGSSGMFNIRARLLLPAFTLLLPLAIGLARRRPLTAGVALVCFVLAGCWFGAYSITGWRYAI